MAQDVIDVILGEAKGGSWEDMLGVASVIYNRARDARATPEQIVKIPSQFNAYGKALPAGVGKYRSLAQKAWDQVQKTGPVHDGSYQMSGGLKPKVKGLVEVAAVPGGHVYYKDPQARPIATTEGYRKPRYTDQMKMAGGMPQLTGPASASATGSANLGNGRGLANLAPNGLRGVEMANAGATRSQPITPTLLSNINQAVENVYGPGYKAQVYSGGQPAKGTSGNRVGTIRHDGGKAGDTYIVDPNGKRLSGDALAPLAQYWAANKIGGVGLEMAGGGIHLDEWSTPPAGGTMAWSYGKLTPTQSGAIDQGLKGEWPQVAAFNRPPIPTPRQPMAQMAAARAFDRGGINDPAKISLNPVSSANAGERLPQVTRSALPAIQERIRPMPTSAPAKTSTGVGYSPAQPPKNIIPKPVNQSFSPSVPMSRPVTPIPAPQKAATVSPATMAAAYQQYGQTRALAPAMPIQAKPQINAVGSIGPQIASLPRIQATGAAGTMATPIAGPLGQPIQAPLNQFPAAPEKPTLKQRAQGTIRNVLSPESIKKAGLTAIGGALAGPVGAAIGGLLGGGMAGSAQGLGIDGRGKGLLAGLLGNLGGSNRPMQSTYIGNGVNAVSNAMYGNRRGDTATYNSQGGGSVTNLGNGEFQRTSSKYGWTETTHADGTKSIKYK